ncbi:proton myo-inositol cotransporter-like [Mercenaria mercenaria]|uniref:proton myo-inositol cotransporter-like n=1 Tax=Mercenaria mercenaria TaxID=6596 RepID=UPI00234F7CCF|nr:proton myo-inositol cotransporter-like [Mercenaria mercenaria]
MGVENGKKYEATDNSQQDEKGSRFFVYYLTCFATMGGLLFGYDTGIISGSMLLIGDNWNLSTIWKELIVSATVGAAALFALIAGYLTDCIGRKKVVMLASVIFTGGAVLMGVSQNKEMLLAGRLVVGAGIGFASMSIPVYVAEAAPADIRGRLVTINQLFITIGILISSIVAGLFSGMQEDGWRYMLGLAGVPSVIQFFGFIGLPESPRWLMEKGRREDAMKALQKIRKVKRVENELKEIEMAIDQSRQAEMEGGKGVLGRMLRTQPVRRALFLGCGMQLFQQLCGINTVIYYSASILKLAGFPVELAIWLVCVPNTVNCLCTFIGIWLVERSGRRWLTIFSMIGVMIGLAVLAIGFQLSIKFTPEMGVYEAGMNNNSMTNSTNKCFSFNLCEDCITDEGCGFCYEKDNGASSGSCLPAFKDNPERYAYLQYNDTRTNNFTDANFRCNKISTWDKPRSERIYNWADSFCPTKYSWMAVLGLALFVMGFAPGLGPMPWTINSEIYPNWARSTGTSLATATNWVFNLIVSLTFLSLLESVGKYGTFWLYFGVCFLGMLFMCFMLPETKNKSLEQVQELFMSAEYKAEYLKNKEANNAPADDTKF